jgi:DNA ligase (NAD+)
MNKLEKIKYLIDILNEASEHYYSDEPIMSDYDWDNMYEELKELEKETDVVYNNSPTHNVGYVVLNGLDKVKHNHPMLSLDKTKSVNDLKKFISEKDCFVSVKCDGLTCSLYYKNGMLVSAETRGNGIEGVSVLSNVFTIKNVPKKIPYKDELIIDGEVIIGWDTFNKINASLPVETKYRHPRNLVSGSLQLLSNRLAESRNMRFVAWRVIKGFKHKSVFDDLIEANNIGFEIVPMFKCDKNNIEEVLERIRNSADNRSIPYDGAVIATDDYSLAESMGRTDKFFRHSIAFKYEDSLYETVLKDIEWNTSKTGLINPIAVFDPIDLDGAVTTRATLHNITYIKDMMLGIGDRIRVYRSNMVIPKVHDSIDKSGNFSIPDKCPICSQPTKIVKENDSEVLICTNPDCKGKLLGKMVHFCSKNAINIDGMSEATLELLINKGWISTFKDLYNLPNDVISYWKNHVSGFSSHSVNKLLKSIEASRETDLEHFIYALSIPMVGKTASKLIAKECEYDFGEFIRSMIMLNPKNNRFKSISGVGNSIITSLDSYFMDYGAMVFELSKEFNFNKPEVSKSTNLLSGKTFVITGSLNHYSNRDELKNVIESNGGKVSGSVSSKTSYLICNEDSNSGKSKKAKDLNIPIITEEEFMKMF